MSKYIKTETVGTILLALEKTECSKNDLLNAIGMLSYILDTKTVDAVEVVRCKDCKYYDTEDNYCNRDIVKSLLSTEPTDFCSWAERRKANDARTEKTVNHPT